jgi:hypothetical protein
MKPYLALFRAGKNSLHPSAVAHLDEQNFDYALSYFGDDEPAAKGAVFVHRQKGAKWPGLAATLAEYADVIAQYRYVWLPDDDLLCEPDQVSRMFAICDELQLDLAQPALTRDSYFTHLATLQHSEFQLRFTNFVEIMAPVLSASMLQRILPTLEGSISGYGLDNLWPRMTQLGKVAIIDETPVKHTRPVGGPNYIFSKQAGMSPAEEAHRVLAGYFVETAADCQINFAGLLQDGEPVCIGPTRDEIDMILKKLIVSANGLKVSALFLTRYLSNHLTYWMGNGEGRSSYPREMVRLVLNKNLEHTGIVFPDPAAQAPVAKAA